MALVSEVGFVKSSFSIVFVFLTVVCLLGHLQLCKLLIKMFDFELNNYISVIQLFLYDSSIYFRKRNSLNGIY
ncbi:hypothetical protein ES332_A05G304500v1 [Gossypium tomentosum]|uniref:Uncharacterized protein n=1 Tax=Gossypium tomentosum TaxID=34277 RepID=A0A5D2QPS1_GOSTO|nr:hypothetical protein ES332_A05G304500v1 [Gossypium tomentosum]